jgi:hypothetical protein
MRKVKSIWIVTAIAALLVALVLIAETAGPTLTGQMHCPAACRCVHSTSVSAVKARVEWPFALQLAGVLKR